MKFIFRKRKEKKEFVTKPLDLELLKARLDENHIRMSLDERPMFPAYISSPRYGL